MCLNSHYLIALSFILLDARLDESVRLSAALLGVGDDGGGKQREAIVFAMAVMIALCKPSRSETSLCSTSTTLPTAALTSRHATSKGSSTTKRTTSNLPYAHFEMSTPKILVKPQSHENLKPLLSSKTWHSSMWHPCTMESSNTKKPQSILKK